MKLDIAAMATGTISRTSIRGPELLDGTPLNVPVVVMRGASPGPTLYLGSTIHGDELIGIEVIRRVMATVQPSELRGSIIGVPVQNPLGFMTRQRFLPAQSIEGFWMDVHTAFPGSPNGELSGVLADLLLQDLIAAADYAIDLHAPMHGGEYVDHAYAPAPTTDRSGRARELARSFGTRIVILQEAGGALVAPSMIHEAATRIGVPTFSVEFATHGQIAEPSVVLGVNGVVNVLRALEMLPGQPVPPDEQIVARDVAYARAQRGGLVDIHCSLGQQVRRGQVLGRVYNLWFEELETIVAPCDGVIYRLAVRRPLHATERLAGIVIPL